MTVKVFHPSLTVFATGSTSTEGMRVDAAESEEPIYASLSADEWE